MDIKTNVNLKGTLAIQENQFDVTGEDHGASGIIVSLLYGESLVPGNVVYFSESPSGVCKADANGTDTYPAIGIALETASDGSHDVLLFGIFYHTAWNWTAGGNVYLSTTAGELTQTQPSATDEVIQVLGIATDIHKIYFNPSRDYITHI